MILDSSAVIAVIAREPGYERLIARMRDADVVGIGTPTLAEIGLVLEGRFGLDARALLERFLQDFEVLTVPFGDTHWRAAVAAYRRFGKGRHKAALNFGDCLSYATARLADQPLLYVGEDFPRTDIESA